MKNELIIITMLVDRHAGEEAIHAVLNSHSFKHSSIQYETRSTSMPTIINCIMFSSLSSHSILKCLFGQVTLFLNS